MEAVREAVRRTVLISDLQDLWLTERAEKESVLTPAQWARLQALREKPPGK